jgi:hypothetical protein
VVTWLRGRADCVSKGHLGWRMREGKRGRQRARERESETEGEDRGDKRGTEGWTHRWGEEICLNALMSHWDLCLH